MRDMNVFYVFLVPLAGLLLVSFVYWLLGVFGMEDDTPLPQGRLVIRQGSVVMSVDSYEEAAELAQLYGGVTILDRRER